MKTIGLIGGISWESSAHYYQIINQAVQRRLGGVHSCQCLMHSVDFGEIEALQRADDWKQLAEMMADAGRRLKRGGADLILICANTMHKVADAVEEASGLPVLHIADIVANEMKKNGLTTAGLLGTRYTMEGAFYSDKLKQHGISTIVPEQEDRQAVHDIIFKELVVGKINPSSKERLRSIVEKLSRMGAEGVILGCTELPMLLGQPDTDVPLYDTTALHAMAGVEYALK